jgi:hypothetical protein
MGQCLSRLVLAAFLGFAGEHRAGAVHHGDNGGVPADCCRGQVSIGRNGSLQVVGYFKGRACRQKQNKPGARRKLNRGSRKK